jgi:hypothetical protein
MIEWCATGKRRAVDARNRLLNDIGVALLEVGLREAAAAAYRAVFLTGLERIPRWGAGINLLETAAAEGRRDSFNQYRAILQHVPFPAWMRAEYYHQLGDGYIRLGDGGEARRAYLSEARFALKHALGHGVKRAFAALRLGETHVLPEPVRLTTVPSELAAFVHDVLSLCEIVCAPEMRRRNPKSDRRSREPQQRGGS